MDKYNELMELKSNLQDNLETLKSSEQTEEVIENIHILENRIQQLELYGKLLDFNNTLNNLYDARRKSTDADEAREIDNDIKNYTSKNYYYFGAQYRNDIASLDPEFYTTIKDKFGVSLMSPERFQKELESGVYVDENNQVNDYTVRNNYFRVTDHRVAPEREASDDVVYGDEKTTDVPNVVDQNQVDITPTIEERTSSSRLTRDDIIQDRELDNPNYEENYNTTAMTDDEIRRAQEELFGPQEPIQTVEPAQDEPAKEEPAWDPRLTEEQILDAKSRDIYEPVGQEYEQFLGNLGLTEREEKQIEEKNNDMDVPAVDFDVVKTDESLGSESYTNDQGQFLIEDKQMGRDPYTNDQGQFLIEDKQMGKDPYTNDQGQFLIEDKQMNNPDTTATVTSTNDNKADYDDGYDIKVGPNADYDYDDGYDIKVDPNDDFDIDIKDGDDFDIQFDDDELKFDDGEDITRDNVIPESTRTVDAPKAIYGRSLESILRSVTIDENDETMDLTKRQRQKITKGKIRVSQNLKQRVSHKNLIYNVLGVTSALIPAVVQSVTKLTNKIYSVFHPKAVRNYNKIIENLYNLSDEDLEVLRTELTANKATELRSYVSILPLVYNRLNVYVEEKYNEPLRKEITAIEVELMDRYRECKRIHAEVERAEDDETRQRLIEEQQEVSKGSCELIVRLRECKLELAHNLEGGPGVHSFAESSKAVDNNQADKGKLFSKKISLKESQEFNEQNAKFSDTLIAQLNAHDDAKALAAFGNKEVFEYMATRESNTVIGKISKGNYNWKAMPESVDYGNDPLMGYLFTTISTIGLVKGVMTEIHNMQLKEKIEEANQHNAGEQIKANQVDAYNQQVNASNQKTIDEIHETGKQLEGRSNDYVQGVNQMSKDSIVSTRTAGEYNAGDATNWSFNSQYRELDHASHEHVHEMYDQANASFDALQKGVSSGTISPAQAVQESQSILNQMNASKYDMYSQFLDTIREYAPKHPQHDYVPLQNELEQIVTNQQAINNMVDGMIESVNAGHSLQEALTSVYQSFSADIMVLPSNIQSIVIPLITQAGITGYLNRLKENYDKKYGTPVDYNDMIEESIVNVVNDDFERQMDRQDEIDESLEEEEGRSR